MHPKILLVEDEPSIADNIIYALKTGGFEPVWCSTGEEALARLAAEKFAPLILVPMTQLLQRSCLGS